MDLQSAKSFSHQALATLGRHNLLMPLIRAEVVRSAVESVQISDEEQAELLKAYCEKRSLNPGDELRTHLTNAGLSEADIMWQVCLEKRIVLYCKKKFIHKAEARFLSKKEQLDKVIYSLLRVKDRLLARELYLRIAGNESDFNSLAQKYSEGKERNTKGIIGPVPLAQAHPALAERLRTTTTGKLIAPFRVGEWWLVVRLERFAEARFEEETAIKMARELFQEWVTEQSRVKVKELNRSER